MKTKTLRAHPDNGVPDAEVAIDRGDVPDLLSIHHGGSAEVLLDKTQARQLAAYITNWLNEGKASK